MLGIGGSATTDGGAGLLRGARRRGRPRPGRLPTSPGSIRGWRGVDLAVACDVSNPLLGPTGAAAVYGPQKGATPGRRRRAGPAARAASPTRSRRPRARASATSPGRARPAASGSRCWPSAGRFRSFALRPGVDLVMEATDFDGTPGQRRPGHHRRGPDRRPDRRSARPRSASPGGRPRRACRASRSVAASSPTGSRPSRRSARSPSRSSSARRSSRRRWPPAPAPLERCGERLARLVSIAAAVDRATTAVGSATDRPTRAAAPSPARRATAQAQVLGSRADLGQAPRALPARARAVRARRPGRAVRAPDVAAPARPDQRADPDDPHPEQRRHQRRGGVRGASHALPGHGRGRGAQPGRRLGRRRAARRRRARLGRGRVRATPRAGRDDLAGRPRQPEGATDPGHAAARSARSAATTRSSSSATCRPSRRAPG